MGKRAQVSTSDIQNSDDSPVKKGRSTRKRIPTTTASGNAGNISNVRPAKASRLNSELDSEDDDEDSSSNDAPVRNCSSKQANNSSIFLNSSLKLHGLEQASVITNESPRPVYTLRPSVVNGTILYDLKQKPWRLGNPIGKGNFGEIFLASDNITVPVTNENAKFVVKVEPHSNGPLFVEIHCLLNTFKKQQNSTQENDIKYENGTSIKVPSGIPDYIASGSHYFGDSRYRFLVLQRFDQDLHSLIKNSCVSQKSLLTLAIQIVNVLENLHDKGYCHNDVKSQNLMISKCKYFNKIDGDSGAGAGKRNGNGADVKSAMVKAKFDENYDERQPTTDSGNSSEQEANDDDAHDDIDSEGDFIIKRKTHYNQDIEDDEDFNDGTTTSNSNSNSMDIYKTPVMKNTKRRRNGNRSVVQYSGSNPVRSCRRNKRPNPIYEEMVSSHYLRPTKRVSYIEFFADDGASVKGETDGDSRDTNFNSAEDDSIGFVPNSLRQRVGASNTSPNKKFNSAQRADSKRSAKDTPCKRLTRRQEKLLLEKQQKKQQQQQQQQKSTPLSHFGSVGAAITTAASTPVLLEAEHIFLIDFGLASKYIDNGVHRPFVMDQRRAHDGTLEFTSRDAHMGAHSRRSDLECLGYNLIFWSQGFLPWKAAAVQQQQEKVHRAKEYLMTDVREMLKQIYGKDVPKYLGEFLHLVGKLAYHERPQYARYRRLFESEYDQLGLSKPTMCLDSNEIASTCIRIKKDYGAEKHDFFELNNKLVNNNVLSIMKGGFGTPFQERGSLGDRVSPKNLRSRSDKKTARKKKFSWTEVLSQDPDQIARERAEKEFDREINYEEDRPVRRYEGKPTYAILELLKKYGERNYHHSLAMETTPLKKQQISEDENDEDDEEENKVNTDSDFDASAEEEQEEEDDEDDEDDDDDDVEEDASDDDEEERDDDIYVNQDKNSSVADEECDDDDDESATSDSSLGTTPLLKKYGKCTKRRRVHQTKQKSKRTESIVKKSKQNEMPKKGLSKNVKQPKKKPARIGKSSAMKNLKNSSKETLSRAHNTRKSTGKQRTAGLASAAGEVEVLAQYRSNQKQHQQQQQQQQQHGNGGVANGKKRRVGRPRRLCPTTTKTETVDRIVNGGGGGAAGGGSNGRILDVEDDSNSNFSPDVRILFNVWKKMSNENIYVKGAAAAATKVATPATGGMVTRHYRK